MTPDPPSPDPAPPVSRDHSAPPVLTPEPAPPSPPLVPPGSPLLPPITLPPGIAPANPDECTMGMLTHLLAIFTGFIAPLVIWLVRKDTSPFLDHHGKEALNFQITYFLISICVMAVSMVVGILTMGIGMLLFFPIYLVIWILALVWEIQACTAASRGEWHYYPVCFRFIP
jgi:uncharacterized Tic20 family protein